MKPATNSKSRISLMMMFLLSLLLLPAAQLDMHAQTPAPAYVDLDAVQLDQLVAPIALDPDSLVAQILTASTYPDQVAEANTWLNQHMNQPPDQRAAGANNMSWDPAVKGLIEFPAELDTLAKNSAWTSQLGNAYYNQPGDVMNAIQAMRLQAQQSNVLVTTVQQRVVVEAGVIEIVPVNPAVIYVPYYNPWRIWGSLFVAYPGFVVLPPPAGVVWASGLAFDPGIAVGVYSGYGWGVDAWAPAWDGGTVLYNNSTYVSNSVTVVNHGYFGGLDRGVFEHEGRGVPRGYRACAHAGTARAHAGRAMAGRGDFRKPSAGRSFPGREARGATHSAYAGRGASSNHGTTGANRGRSSIGHGSTSTASRGRSSASRGTTTANRSGANANRGTSMAHNATSNRGGTTANHRTSSATRGNATASRGGSSPSRGRTTASNRSAASANRGAATAANHGSSVNRGGATANHSASSASRGSAIANRGGASPSRGSAMANRGGASTSHGGAMANRGGASAGHSGGGHASGGRGKGR